MTAYGSKTWQNTSVKGGGQERRKLHSAAVRKPELNTENCRFEQLRYVSVSSIGEAANPQTGKKPLASGYTPTYTVL